MTNPDVFYNKEDLWSLPIDGAGGEQRRGAADPYYVIMKIPGEAGEEFVLMQPMTPANRSNMVAWIAARSDPPHYGELVVYELPKERLVYGPQQIEARIDQDTTISQQLSLWNQMGSKVIRGNLLVIPVEDAMVYVEPLYLRSTQGQIPELKRVIVAYDDRLAMERTLDAALAAVFRPRRGAPAAARRRRRGRRARDARDAAVAERAGGRPRPLSRRARRAPERRLGRLRPRDGRARQSPRGVRPAAAPRSVRRHLKAFDGRSEATPHHAHEAAQQVAQKGRDARREGANKERSRRLRSIELRRTSERPSNDADRPFSATCYGSRAAGRHSTSSLAASSVPASRSLATCRPATLANFACGVQSVVCLLVPPQSVSFLQPPPALLGAVSAQRPLVALTWKQSEVVGVLAWRRRSRRRVRRAAPASSRRRASARLVSWIGHRELQILRELRLTLGELRLVSR